MSGTRSRFRNRAEDLGVAAAGAVGSLVPARLQLAAVEAFGWLAFQLLRQRRAHALQLVQRALAVPADSPRARQIVRGAFRSLALNGVETGLVDRARLRGEPVQSWVTVEGAEHMRAALDSGRGVLLCGAHLGAWELIPLVQQQLFGPVWAMARSMDNPLLERRMLAKRQNHMRGTVPKDGGSLKLARILRDGEAVGLLLDQNAGQHGVILDFLGMPSSHHTVAGVMARRFGALVLPLYMLREPGRLRFRMVIEPAIEADPALSDEAAALDVTRRVSQSLERQVRAHPEQWLWLHDRWRHAERTLRRARREAASHADPAASTPADDTHWPAAQGTNGT